MTAYQRNRGPEDAGRTAKRSHLEVMQSWGWDQRTEAVAANNPSQSGPVTQGFLTETRDMNRTITGISPPLRGPPSKKNGGREVVRMRIRQTRFGTSHDRRGE